MHKNKFNYFYLSCGLLMLSSEIWKQWYLTFILNHGYYNWWYFPFQLCSIAMYLCLLIPFVRSRKISAFLLTFLMDYSLLGGVFVFFDTSGMHYPHLPLTVHSYAWHFLLIFIGLYTGLSGQAGFSWKDYFRSSMLYLACCGIATVFNLAFYPFGKINMFYISPHFFMNQKVFIHISEALGNPFGILSYILATLSGAALFHSLWRKLS